MNKVTIELSTSDILHILECTSYLDSCGVVQRIIRKVRKGVKEEWKMKIEVAKDRKEIAKIIMNVSQLWYECKVMKAPAYEMADAIILYFIEKEEGKDGKQGNAKGKYGHKQTEK